MWRCCEPLYDGDPHEHCGVWFNDARRSTICPHVSLDGGDSVGIGPKANRGQPPEES